ncbi:MAG: SusC/RagA family TonB-linked outer membrane protein [Saprospiraceae bacterium]|nr:SusC/RagA family TonB-linked outer membrane protein [Saprospiraceae bacterium]
MKRILQLCLVLSLLLLTFTAFAQEIEVAGKVTDDKNEALPGVNILIKGTSTGTATNAQGDFTIKVNIGDKLVFSYIGYETKELSVDSEEIRLKLLSKPIQLSEAVICQLGRESLISRTGCPTQFVIKEAYLYAGNIYHPYQLLRGRVAGLTISKPGGDPLGTFDVYQRGLHSILGATEPLIVIDGLPGASLQTIDVQDIETITLLRDASMTSLYGTRGANGVILIESKKGRNWNKFKINYNVYASIENAINTPDVLNAAQYRTFSNNPNANFGADTDWADAITRTGASHAHNLNFSGGFKNTGYRLSLNYRAINGVVNNSGLDQNNALLNISQGLFKNKIRLQANAGLTRRNFSEIDKDVFYYAAIYNPTAPIRTDTGYFQQLLFDYYNPVALIEGIDNKGEQNIYTAGLNAHWDILNGLRAQVQYNWQQQAYARRFRVADTYLFDGFGFRFFDYDAEADLSNQSFTSTILYNFYKNNHGFTLSGGYQYQEWTNELYNVNDYDLAVNGLRFANENFISQPDSAAIAYKTNTRLAAFFGRLQYDYNNWLFVNAHWRREGSTRFGDNNKWGNFYGFGTGIDIANLAHWSDIQQFKIRLNYGVAGNLPADGIYAKGILRPGGKTLYKGYYIDIYTPVTNANPDLKWEERREWNLGLDASFFNDRLFTSFEFYRGKSKDLIYNYYTEAPPNLATLTYANYVGFENRGVEISLNAYLSNRSDFSWELGMNLAADRPKFTSAITPEGVDNEVIMPSVYLGIPGACCAQPSQLRKGEPLGRLYGLEFDRFENGTILFKDRNRDGIISEADFTEIGRGLPQLTLGFMNDIHWKKLEFNFFLRGVLGHDIINTHRVSYGFPGNIANYNVLESAVTGENSQVPYSQGISSYNVENASFLTLENLVIGYNFNTQKRHFSTLNMYVAAQNLFTLADYSGNDPEARLKNKGGNFHTGNTLVPGFDVRVGYYATRTFTLGVQAEF